MTIILASRSPRRRELLAQIGVPFEALSVEVDEQCASDETAAACVERLAIAKAEAGHLMRPGRPVLGADTLVILDGHMLGKPENKTQAKEMLLRLSGREHRVMTGVAVAGPAALATRLSVSRVRFRSIAPTEAAAYVATGEPADKAGAYAIQGLGAIFVEHLEGSYSGVMGLPLYETAQLLREFDVVLP